MLKIETQNINFSELKPGELPSLPLEWRLGLPKCAGLYLVISFTGEVLYVGQSTNLNKRWLSHHRQAELEKIEGVRIAWIEVTDTTLLMSIESALIKHFEPYFNQRRGIRVTENFDSPMKKLRFKVNLRTVDVACKINVAESTVRNWEAGCIVPNLKLSQFFELLRLYKCTLEELEEAMKETLSLAGNSVLWNDSWH